MVKISRSFIWIAVVVVVVVVFGFVFLSIRLNQKQSREQAEAVIASTQAAENIQTFQATKVPVLEKTDRFVGEAKAKIKIFVYEDYSSQYSADLAETLKRLASDYSGQVVIVFRPFLSNNPSVVLGAQALDCSGDKWPMMRDSIFKLVKDNKLSAAGLAETAGQNGLDSDDFAKCLSALPNPEKSAKIAQEIKDYSILGAPTMFINDSLIVGARPYDDYTDSNGDKVAGLKNVIESLK